MPSVLFSGYYGFGNCGDEAVLEASVALLRARRPEVEIAALSASPAATASDHGIRSCRRGQPRELVAALRRCDLLLSGGGSLLQDRTSLRSLLYYLAVIQLGLALRRRVMIYAQGIGPLLRPAARRLTGRLLRRADRITVRDDASRDVLRSLGVCDRGGPEVIVTADPAFALQRRPTPRVAALLAAARDGAAPLVAVNLRPWAGIDHAAAAVAAGLSALPQGAAVILCPFQPGEDRAPCAAVAAGLRGRARLVEEALAPGEWAALLGGVDLVLAARLHALIFAAAAATPALGIAYDPKVTALQARVAQPDLGPPERLGAEALQAAVEASLAAAATTRSDREERASDLRAAAARNAELALEALPRVQGVRGSH
jgi:polysaccharide pyruvyl transferase CsaB